MKKRKRKNATKINFISCMLGIVLVIILGYMLKTMVSASKLEHTYALRVATGVGDGSCIGFFAIEYKGEDEQLYTHYVFPHEGDYNKSYQNIMQKVDFQDQSRCKQVSELGYFFEEWDDISKKGIMDTFSEDIFFFEIPEHTIASVENIYIYTDIAAGNTNSWTCTGLEVYEVEEINGRRMYGYVSGDQYVSFSGRRLASLTGNPPPFTTAKDTVFTLSPSSNEYKLDTTISAYPNDSDTANCEYIFKLDIADIYGAGIETFINYNGLQMKKMSFPEVLNLEIVYQCTSGRNQVVYIPVITGAYANAMANCNTETQLVDFMGQGESIAVPANLPYFKNLVSVKVSYGPNVAMKDSGLKEISTTRERKEQKEKIIKNVDTISLAAISMYKAGEDASTLTYEVQDDTILVPKISGDPLYYYAADTYRGIEIGLDKTIHINMLPYEEGVRLEPRDNQAKYLVVVETDSVTTANSQKTIPNISLQLTYTTTSGFSTETENYSLKELAKDYYGYIPNSSGEDCSYAMNVCNDQRLFTIISLSNVEQFTAASFGLMGPQEEWQMKGFAIYRIDELSKRHAQWIPKGREFFNQTTKISYYREINETGEMFPKSAEIYSAEVKMLIQNADKQKIDFNSLNIVEKEKSFDWIAIDKYSLAYKKADANYLGFYNVNMDYQIDVKVANNSNNTMDDGDSGSKNYFYFQLVFQDGSSSVVQANQLLEADGFLTGQIATFNISTNYDYGELLAVRVIPDDFTENADPYDKLNIEYINVTKKAPSGYATVWTVANVGWVGIDYKDDGAEDNVKTEKGRTLEELAYTYNVTGSSAGVEIQFAITTGAFPIDGDGKTFVGTIMADVGYMDAKGGYKTVSFDVVQSMHNYANKIADTIAKNGKRQSNPSFMFQENRTNRFTHFFSDVSELVNIRLYVYSDNGGILNISSISASLVVDEGPLAINNWGEYERKSTLFPLTKNANPIEVFEVGSSDEVSASIAFQTFETGMLTGLINGTWPYDVKQKFSIGEDYLNINVYPQEEISDIPELVMEAILDYSDSYGRTYRVQDKLTRRITDSGTLYYGIDGLRVSDMEAIKEVRIRKVSGTGDMELGDVIVQKVRSGQIVQTSLYNLQGKKVSTTPVATTTSAIEDVGEIQKVRLSFENDMPKISLTEGVRDVAVALHYTSSYDPNGQEYISSYVYLSESKINSISGGQIGEFEFHIPNIEKITGISVAATGGLSIGTENAIVTVYQMSDGVMKMTDFYSVCEGGKIENQSKNFKITTDSHDDTNTLVPIDMELTTGTLSGQNTGTDAAIRMKIQYTGFDERSYQTEINDLRKYTVSGSYNTGDTAKIQLILANIKEISSITFEPYDEYMDSTETWKLDSISVTYGIDSNIKNASITLTEEKSFAYENRPIRVVLKKILVDMQYRLGEETVSVKDMTGGCIMKSDEEMYLSAYVENSKLGSNIEIYEIIDESRRNVTSTYLSETSVSGEWMFKVPTEDISEDTTFEVVAVSEEMSEFKASFKVVVKKSAQLSNDTETLPEDEEGTQESPKDEESTQESPKDEESTQESPKDEESTQESPKEEESTQESPKDEESTQESSKDEESTQESSKDEESTQESPKDEEGTQG